MPVFDRSATWLSPKAQSVWASQPSHIVCGKVACYRFRFPVLDQLKAFPRRPFLVERRQQGLTRRQQPAQFRKVKDASFADYVEAASDERIGDAG